RPCPGSAPRFLLGRRGGGEPTGALVGLGRRDEGPPGGGPSRGCVGRRWVSEPDRPAGRRLRDVSAGLLVCGVLAAARAVLVELDALALVHPVLGGDVVALLALRASERDLGPVEALRHGRLLSGFSPGGRVQVVAWHEGTGGGQPTSRGAVRPAVGSAGRGGVCGGTPSPRTWDYLVILVTRPAPTVRPPSRMANFSPSSIAIGAISSTDISVLSPGI